jgi:hypothetical protein
MLVIHASMQNFGNLSEQGLLGVVHTKEMYEKDTISQTDFKRFSQPF